MSDLDPSKLDKLKVSELQEELKNRGLDTKGKKAVLIKRLKEALGDSGPVDVSVNFDESSQDASQTSFTEQDSMAESESGSQDQDSPTKQEPVKESPAKKEAAASPVKPSPVKPSPVKDSPQKPKKTSESDKQNDVQMKEEKKESAQVSMKIEEMETGDEEKTDKEEKKVNGEAAEDEFTVDIKVESKPDDERGSKRKRSRSRSHDGDERRSSREKERKPKAKKRGKSPIDEEDDDWWEWKHVSLDKYNSDLNLRIDKEGMKAEPLNYEGFAMVWAGVRGTYGVNKGKVAFEVKLLEELDVKHYLSKEEANPHILRVGWSTDDNSMQLGEEEHSYCYDGTGKSSTESKFTDFGEKFGADDVITAYLDLESDPSIISFAKNGNDLGECFKVEKSSLGEKALFPHILTKNTSFEVNFGGREEPWFPLKEGFVFINTMDAEERVRGTLQPYKKEDCEVLMMCGLPASGKTTWAEKQLKVVPEAKYIILGTHSLIDRMKVMGLPRKDNYAGRWDVLVDKTNRCINRLYEFAAKRKRNYILDQTNVYASARRRKMQPFEGFQRKAIVIVPSEEDFKTRTEAQKQNQEEEKDVKENAVLEMKANFTLPDVGRLFDELEFPELDREKAEELVEKYREEGQKALPPPSPPEKKFREDSGGFGGRGRDDRGGGRDDRRSGGSRWGGGGGGGGGGRDRWGGGGGGGRDRWGGGGGGGGRGGGRDRLSGGGGGGGYGEIVAVVVVVAAAAGEEAVVVTGAVVGEGEMGVMVVVVTGAVAAVVVVMEAVVVTREVMVAEVEVVVLAVAVEEEEVTIETEVKEMGEVETLAEIGAAAVVVVAAVMVVVRVVRVEVAGAEVAEVEVTTKVRVVGMVAAVEGALAAVVVVVVAMVGSRQAVLASRGVSSRVAGANRVSNSKVVNKVANNKGGVNKVASNSSGEDNSSGHNNSMDSGAAMVRHQLLVVQVLVQQQTHLRPRLDTMQPMLPNGLPTGHSMVNSMGNGLRVMVPKVQHRLGMEQGRQELGHSEILDKLRRLKNLL